MVSILLYHCTTYSQKEKFPEFTRPDGLIDKNPCRNATRLLYQCTRSLLNISFQYVPLCVGRLTWATESLWDNILQVSTINEEIFDLNLKLEFKIVLQNVNELDSNISSQSNNYLCLFLTSHVPSPVTCQAHHLSDMTSRP